jgi:hypothetical protein
MALSVSQKGKGRLHPADTLDRAESFGFSSRSSTSSGSSTSSLSSSSESESESEPVAGSSEEEDEDDISQEYLDSLLEKARATIAEKVAKNTPAQIGDALEEDVIRLNDPESELECVFLASSLPTCVFSSTSEDSLHLTLALCHHPILHLASLNLTRHQPSGTWMSNV